MCGAMMAQPVWKFGIVGWNAKEPTGKQAPPAGKTSRGNYYTVQPVPGFRYGFAFCFAFCFRTLFAPSAGKRVSQT